MIRRIAAMMFLVCTLGSAQTARQADELYARLHLAEVARSQGRLADAESILVDLETGIERTEGPGVRLALVLRERGLVSDDEDRSDNAIRFYERALTMLKAQPSASPFIVGVLLANLAISHADCGHFDAALSRAVEALTSLGAGIEPSRPEIAVALYARGIALNGLGRTTEALQDLRQALGIWQHSDAPDYAQVALVHEAIGSCLFALGFATKSESSEREALAIRIDLFGPDSLSVAVSLNNLGVMLARQERASEARQLFERAKPVFEQLGENEQPRLAALLGNLGTLYYNQSRDGAQLYTKAEAAYRRKLAIEERIFGLSDVRVSATLEMLGEILYRERAYNEAGRIYARGLQIQQVELGPADPKTQAALKRYQILAKKMKPDSLK